MRVIVFPSRRARALFLVALAVIVLALAWWLHPARGCVVMSWDDPRTDAAVASAVAGHGCVITTEGGPQ